MSVDMEKLQSDVYGKLASEELFDTVNVVLLRKLQIESEVDASLIWMTPKGGKLGAGILVSMPTIEVPDPNVPGPEMKVTQSFRAIENPTVNQDPTQGTGITAETIAVNGLMLLHQVAFNGLCALYAAKQAIVPNVETAGVVAYDVFLEAKLPIQPLHQVTIPDAAENGGLMTLTNLTVGATIYYTTDESFPGKSNAAAVVYAAPFAVTVGTVVRWAAYKTGMRGSDVGYATVS